MSKTRITIEIDDWAAPQVASFLQLLQATIESPAAPIEGVSLQVAAINSVGEASSTMIEISRAPDGSITAPISVALMGVQCGTSTGGLGAMLYRRGYEQWQVVKLSEIFQQFANRTIKRLSAANLHDADNSDAVDRLTDELRTHRPDGMAGGGE